MCFTLYLSFLYFHTDASSICRVSKVIYGSFDEYEILCTRQKFNQSKRFTREKKTFTFSSDVPNNICVCVCMYVMFMF